MYKGYVVCVLIKIQPYGFRIALPLDGAFLRIWRQFIFLKDIKKQKSQSKSNEPDSFKEMQESNKERAP